MADENTQPKSSPQEKPAAAAPKAAPKKEKPPAIEKKPFSEFIQEHYLPTLEQTLNQQGLTDLNLAFTQGRLDVLGLQQSPECWQVQGQWLGGQRQFTVAFLKEDIKGQKVFTCADNGGKPSTIESFMIDERKVTLDLLVLYVVQRLNGQKWLQRN